MSDQTSTPDYEAAIEASARYWARASNGSGDSLSYPTATTDDGWESYMTEEHEGATIAAVDAALEGLVVVPADDTLYWLRFPHPDTGDDETTEAAYEFWQAHEQAKRDGFVVPVNPKGET